MDMVNIPDDMRVPQFGSNPGKKITLRRCLSKERVVRNNLANMKLRSAKKRIAQALYYGTEEFLSPIKKMEDDKIPVHQRLGRKKLILRRQVNIAGTHTSSLPPKMRLGIKRTHYRRFTVQPRLLKYRLNPDNPATTLGILTQKQNSRFRLHRNAQNITTPKQPLNFVVQVKNQNATSNVCNVHSVKGSLRQDLQEEIRAIQQQTTIVNQSIGDGPILVIATGITLHSRVSALP